MARCSAVSLWLLPLSVRFHSLVQYLIELLPDTISECSPPKFWGNVPISTCFSRMNATHGSPGGGMRVVVGKYSAASQGPPIFVRKYSPENLPICSGASGAAASATLSLRFAECVHV